MKRRLIFILFILLVISCSEKDSIINSGVKIISVKNITNCDILNYSELYDSLKIIRLETSESCFIGYIDDLIFYKDKIFIIDKFISKSVFLFDSEGNFISKVGALGNGPGEYLNPTYITLNTCKDQLLVYDNLKKIILSYNLNGEYIKSLKLEFRIDAFSVTEPDKMVLYYNYFGNENIKYLPKHNIHVINERGKVLLKAFNRVKSIKPNNNGLNNFCNYNNQILFNPSFDNNIYKFTTNGFLTKYYIDFGLKSLNENILKKLSKEHLIKEDIYDAIQASGYIYIVGFQESNNFIILTVSYEKKLYNIFYSKLTGEIKCSNIYINDMYGLIPGSHRLFLGSSDENVISYFGPSEISLDYYQQLLRNSLNDKDFVKREFLKNIKKTKDNMCAKLMFSRIENSKFHHSLEEVNLIDSLNYNSNPVLIIGKLKNF